MAEEETLGCGYSAVAIFFTFILSILMIAVLIATGFRWYNPDIPVAGSCSAGISAACHPRNEEDMSKSAVQWGSVSTSTSAEQGIGHCCITNQHVSKPTQGHLYA